ncbi:fibroblast growth factor receptor-like [Stylophora pistillata]|uniref:fibroblast growth factor receptor-like n=1 Tax=Stylophora pistillata TaxID=50429 RepID=UPI000C0555B9|nr:fibroblast growth factor receptor-like [Stylophora pistillata]
MTAEWIRKTDQQSVRMESFPPDKVDPGPEYKKFYLKIEAVSIHDAGWYTCQANSSFGSDKVSIFLHVITGEEKKNGDTVSLIVLSFVSGFLCLGILGCFVYYKRRVSALRNVDRLENFTLQSDADTLYLSVSASRWEIAPKQIHLQSILGTGAFGEVWKAAVYEIQGHPEETTVAVKKLKRNCTDHEQESLAQEIELGKSLNGDKHPNIVNFLACVSTCTPMMLVLEYAPYGDVLGYLRKSRGVEDQFYCSPECCQKEVTSYDLLSFAQQIASGMSFLASKKILHRDLAARNVLLGAERICKISDFGLALIRDKYEQYLYCTAIRKGRLPIKWTAPEHLFNVSDEKNLRVSEKSDVWSYGIVLFEIFTLGGVPYPGWNEWKVVYELKVNKYRMPQPEHVSEEQYQLMVDCWNEDPDARPTFDLLHEVTTSFLQEEHYVDMSKYEPSLYANVEEMATSAGPASFENLTTVL